MTTLLAPDEITAALAELPGWRRDGDSLVAAYTAPSFLAGIELVRQVAQIAEDLDHHPDIGISWTRIDWTLSTHSEGGVTGKDVELAHHIGQLAREHGATPADD